MELADVPTSIGIPKINAVSTLVPLGLAENNQHEVPPVDKPEQAGWYEYGPRPGDPGPAIILGHINGHGKPGIFYHLDKLVAGDDVLIVDNSGRSMRFTVYKTESVPKDDFPADRVYGNTDTSELRLITCGGAYDAATHNYKNNTIVYARINA